MIPTYNKFSAKKTEVDGIVFASKREAARYQELKLMQKGGFIKNLQVQVPFMLNVNGKTIGKYVADFTYDEPRDDGYKWVNNGHYDRSIVEDCKGMRTPMYRWKKKHVEAQYGIKIKET